MPESYWVKVTFRDCSDFARYKIHYLIVDNGVLSLFYPNNGFVHFAPGTWLKVQKENE